MNVETKVPARVEAQPQKYPLGLFDELREEMERLWARPFGIPAFGRSRRLERDFAWMPTADVMQKNGDLLVRADLPGVKKEDVQVTLTDDQLEIRGERRRESEVAEKGFHRSECEYGSFYRRIPLAFSPDPARIAAKFADGVLEVRIPMPAAKRPDAKQIEVS